MKKTLRIILFSLLIIPFAAFGIPTLSKIQAHQLDIKQLNKLMKKSLAGDSKSATYLGLAYIRGAIGLNPNYEEAVYWLRKASASDPIARAYLSVLYWEGCGTPQNTQIAREEAEIAFHGLQGEFAQLAEKPHFFADTRRLAEVEYTLGLFYFWGVANMVDQDLSKAFDLFKAAASLGHVYSIQKVAMMYRYGIGVVKDPVQAFMWNKLLADLSLTFAAYMLGIDYWNGFGVEKNNTQAFYWVEKAAHNGYYPALVWLANSKT